MRTYATLWNSGAKADGNSIGFYQSAGCLMLDSLFRHSKREPARAYVLALDDDTERITAKWAESRGWSDSVIVLPLAWLTNREPLLLTPRVQSRPVNYWCFTLAAPLCAALLEFATETEVDTVAYVDADCYWWSDPASLWESFWGSSVGIVPHGFPPHKRDHANHVGQYNVGVTAFRADATGRACASRWAADVIAKCDPDTCGDQKYLDRWPSLWPGKVKVFGSIGVGVAPWNYAGHEFAAGNPPMIDGTPITVQHLHESRRTADGFKRTGWPIPDSCARALYDPWEAKYLEIERELEALR